MPLTDDQLATLLAILDGARDVDPSDPRYLALEQAVAHLAKTAKKRRRLARSRARPKYVDRPPCYVCKRRCDQPFAGFVRLCADCAGRTGAMRHQPLDVTGRRALVTGGRVKIGYATALALLRGGAEVHATTRFPNDAAARYASEPDASDWSGRLHVHGLDLRDLGRVLTAVDRWREGPPFDILVNNAAQSIVGAPGVFAALYAREQRALPEAAPDASALALLPAGVDPAALARLDTERADSWRQRLREVAPVDVVEVLVVNAIAPFLIASRLADNLARSPFADRYVVNVSAAEGQFDRANKSERHPHTNMAKAGLNMLTRTSASDLRQDGIYMVSVDPGWLRSEEAAIAPLDPVDCAARVLHPVAQGLAGEPVWGVLLKDFAPIPW